MLPLADLCCVFNWVLLLSGGLVLKGFGCL